MANSTKYRILGTQITTTKSESLHQAAGIHEPGGVQGAGRYYEPYPLFINRAKGARLWDVDGNEYIDFHCAYGPVILGHADERVNQAVKETMDNYGVLFANPHPREVELAKLISQVVPSGEKTVFTNSGTEGVYHALRVSRAYTGREKIIKFEGGYNGWIDDVSASIKPTIEAAGPANEPNVVPASAGMTKASKESLIIVPYNDLSAIENAVKKNKDEIAAIIVEPVLHSCGCIKPQEGYLEGLREISTANDILLIFDEIITLFRHHQGGAQKIFGVTPDLTTFGKAFSNGYPISGVTGKNKYMSMFAPEGPVFFSGTFNGHPLNVSAALKTQEILRDGTVHEYVWHLGQLIGNGINKVIRKLGVKARCEVFGAEWSLFFTDKKPINYRDLIQVASTKNDPLMRAYLSSLLNNGIYVQPFYVVRSYISAAHTEDDIGKTIDVTEKFLKENKNALS